MKIIHNVRSWFGEEDANLLNYFEQDFSLNTIGTFKAPSSMVARFNNFADDSDKMRAIESIGNIFISALATSPKGMKLRQIPFAWLEEDTQYHLRQSVCEAIQHAVLNKNVWERINASSISTPNFSMNSDTSNWLLTADLFGQIARTVIVNSGINDYEWIEEATYYQETPEGNVKIIGKASLDTLQELSI